ncbi:MAG: VWA domain-containing protein [Acidobacteria bacterium]|nr:VWA domain-containing protein [Acidobacteriota bacterium]
MKRRAVALLVAIGPAVAATPASTQQPTFTTRVDLVRVDVSVTRGRQPVGGLRAADFEVFDNGVRQQIESASIERLPLNVFFVIDVSQSVAGAKLDELREAAETFLDGLEGDDRAGLITFSHEVLLGSDLTPSRSSIAEALQQPVASGGTSLRDAIYAGLALRRADAHREVLLVCTDGLDTASWLTEAQLQAAASRGNSLLYVVGLAPPGPGQKRSGSESFLAKLADLSGGRVWHAESSDWLKRAFLEVLADIRTRYMLTYYPTNVPLDGWHALTVRVARQGLIVKAREGYYAEKP